MKLALAASIAISLTASSPTLANDDTGMSPAWSSRMTYHPFSPVRAYHYPPPGLVWIGRWYDPLLSWDDGFFSDLKYGRDNRYGHRPRPRGKVEVVNGEARYHYDRSYPYRRYDDHRARAYGRQGPTSDSSDSISCRTQLVWSPRDREQVPVRICS